MVSKISCEGSHYLYKIELPKELGMVFRGSEVINIMEWDGK